MIRCNICDFVLDNVGPQSNFFNSLPEEERSKRRVKVYDPVTKTFSVGCAGCSEPIRRTRMGLTPEQVQTLGEKENAPAKPYTSEELGDYIRNFFNKNKK